MLSLVCFPVKGWSHDVNSYNFALSNSMFVFPFVSLPVAHLSFIAVKRCYRPISWISLYVWRGDFPLVVLKVT